MRTDDEGRIEVFHRLNRLKLKAGGSLHGGPGRFDARELARAQAAVQAHAPKFPPEAAGLIAKMIDAYMGASELPAAERGPAMSRIGRFANELQSLGGMFDYPLVTRFGRSLRDFAEKLDDATTPQMTIVRAHIDALDVVMRGRMTGDGGEVGAELTRELERAMKQNAPSLR